MSSWKELLKYLKCVKALVGQYKVTIRSLSQNLAIIRGLSQNFSIAIQDPYIISQEYVWGANLIMFPEPT